MSEIAMAHDLPAAGERRPSRRVMKPAKETRRRPQTPLWQERGSAVEDLAFDIREDLAPLLVDAEEPGSTVEPDRREVPEHGLHIRRPIMQRTANRATNPDHPPRHW